MRSVPRGRPVISSERAGSHQASGVPGSMIDILVATPLAPTSLTHLPPRDAPGVAAARATIAGEPVEGAASRDRPRPSVSVGVDGADVPGVATGRGARESVWIGPARRHAPSVGVEGRGFYLAVWAMPSGPGGGCPTGGGAVTARATQRPRMAAPLSRSTGWITVSGADAGACRPCRGRSDSIHRGR